MDLHQIFARVDKNLEARFDADAGVLYLGKHMVDVRTLKAILTLGPDYLWRFYEEDGSIQVEPIEYESLEQAASPSTVH